MNFDTMYRRHFSDVESQILAVVSDREEAAELSQEVFLRVHEAYQHGRVPANVGRWVERLARAAAARHVARKAVRREVPLGAMPFARRVDTRPWANPDAWLELGGAA